MNNVKYLELFDTVINTFLIRSKVLDLSLSSNTMVGFCVESKCNYFSPLAFPQVLTLGLKVKKMGRTSVVYEVGIFVDGGEDENKHDHFWDDELDDKEDDAGNLTVGDRNDEGFGKAKAHGHFVHCFVNQESGKSCEMSGELRRVLEKIT